LSKAVFIQPPWEGGATRLFSRYPGRFHLVGSPEECDIIVFNGGEDINPALYGEEMAHMSYYSPRRDEQELAGYRRAKDKFKFGICRGGQLLNVLSGGSLWQDVNNHAFGSHPMTCALTGRTLETTSVHHQQMIPADSALMVAYTEGLATEKHGEHRSAGPGIDPEILWYGHTRSLCIQGHPEYHGEPEFTEYCIDLIDRFY
jgi:GMP synthase-like glutamine amidotransferase